MLTVRVSSAMGMVSRKAKNPNEVWLLELPVPSVHDIKNALDFAVATCPEDRWPEFRRAKAVMDEAILGSKVKEDGR